MKFIGGIIVTLNFILILGIVGGMEHNRIPLSNGFWICVLLFGISAVILKGMEIYQNFKNNSEKPLDKSE